MRITQLSNQYSPNLAENGSFENPFTVTVTVPRSGATAVVSTEQAFDGTKCLKSVNPDKGDFAYNLGAYLQYTAERAGAKFVSLRVFFTKIGQRLDFQIQVGGTDTQLVTCEALNDNIGVWTDFGYKLPFSTGNVVNVSFIHKGVNGNDTMPLYVDAFAINNADRLLLESFPPYTPPQ